MSILVVVIDVYADDELLFECSGWSQDQALQEFLLNVRRLWAQDQGFGTAANALRQRAAISDVAKAYDFLWRKHDALSVRRRELHVEGTPPLPMSDRSDAAVPN